VARDKAREPRGGSCLPLKEKEREMRNTVRIIGMSLASMAGILLVPGIASAQALKTPIEGSWANCFDRGEPDREWVDEDGIIHVRGQRYRCRHDGDIVGRENGVFDFDSDPDAGTRFEHGTSSFGGQILGVPASSTAHWTVVNTLKR